MKKYLVLVAIIGFSVATLCSCGGKFGGSGEKGITVKGADGTVYESYQECCAANDYEAAHLFLAKMYDKESYTEDDAVAKEYVFKKEALFLMSQGDDAAKKRIIYLLKEEGGNDDHVSMLIDLAIENGDAEFVKTLMGQYAKDIKDKEFEKLIKFFIEKQDDEYIFKLLTDVENKIPARPALGLVKSNHYGELDYTYVDFNKQVKKYNNACRVILNGAIAEKNQSLAQKAITKLKSTLVGKELGDWVRVVEKEKDHSSLYNAFKVTLDNSDASSIKAAYQEAVRSGAFK